MKYLLAVFLVLAPSISQAAQWRDPFAPPPNSASAVEGDGWWALVGVPELDDAYWLSQYIPEGMFIRQALEWAPSYDTVSDMGAPSVEWLEQVLESGGE